MRRTLICALALAPAVAAAPGLVLAQASPEIVIHVPAQEHTGQKTDAARVSLADLNLGSDDGAEAALGRIRKAAERACSPEPHHGARFRDVQNYNNCVSGVINDAVRQARSPRLQAVHQRAD